MAEKYRLSTFLWVAGSFFGGLAAGALLTPTSGRQNRVILYRRSADVKYWIDRQQKKIRIRGRKKLRNLRHSIAGSYQQNIPNLYEATAQIDLSGHQLN